MDNDKKNLKDVEELIMSAVQQTRYGTVEIVIHDSKVVQIERSEKVRL